MAGIDYGALERLRTSVEPPPAVTDWRDDLRRIRAVRERLTRDRSRLDIPIFNAITAGTAAGASESQIGALLGVTKQRVSQLRKEIAHRMATIQAQKD